MWHLDYDPDRCRLTLQLARQVGAREMRDLSRAHARALEATGGQTFRILMDLRGLYPLDGESAELLADMKRVASSLESYQRRAILVDSATIAMQQRNATLESGGDSAELITWDEAQAEAHLS